MRFVIKGYYASSILHLVGLYTFIGLFTHYDNDAVAVRIIGNFYDYFWNFSARFILFGTIPLVATTFVSALLLYLRDRKWSGLIIAGLASPIAQTLFVYLSIATGIYVT